MEIKNRSKKQKWFTKWLLISPLLNSLLSLFVLLFKIKPVIDDISRGSPRG